jgi:hypothetical protein
MLASRCNDTLSRGITHYNERHSRDYYTSLYTLFYHHNRTHTHTQRSSLPTIYSRSCCTLTGTTLHALAIYIRYDASLCTLFYHYNRMHTHNYCGTHRWRQYTHATVVRSPVQPVTTEVRGFTSMFIQGEVATSLQYYIYFYLHIYVRTSRRPCGLYRHHTLFSSCPRSEARPPP